jgi:hypothetical protein
MRRKRTWKVCKVERALRIGFGVKRTSNGKIEGPEFVGLAPSLCGGQAVPFVPLLVEFFVPRLFGGLMHHPVKILPPT